MRSQTLSSYNIHLNLLQSHVYNRYPEHLELTYFFYLFPVLLQVLLYLIQLQQYYQLIYLHHVIEKFPVNQFQKFYHHDKIISTIQWKHNQQNL